MDQTPQTLAASLTLASGSAYRNAVRATMTARKVISVAGVREHFVRSQTPYGVPWKPLKHPRPSGGGTPLRDTGLLLASVSAEITEEGIALKASHPGANVHQFGAVIRPVRAKALTIPLTPEAKRTGSPGRGRFPRPLFIYRTHNDHAFLAESTANGLTLHYRLEKEVRIPAREFLGFSDATLAKLDKILADAYEKEIAKAFGA